MTDMQIDLWPPVVSLQCLERGDSVLVRAVAYDATGEMWDWQMLLDRVTANAYPELTRYAAQICMRSLEQKMLAAGAWSPVTRLERSPAP
jgi:hypothetical protein